MLGIQEMKLSEFMNINSPTVISKEIAFNVCRDSWNNDKNSGPDIFHLWSTKLLTIVDHTKFTSNDWNELIKCFKDIIRHMVSTTPSENARLLTDLTRWMADSMHFLKFTQHILPNLKSLGSCVILGFFTETIGQFFDFYEKCHREHDLKSHLQLTLGLYKTFLRVLTDHTDELQVTNDEDVAYLLELGNALCDVGGKANQIDMKSTIETCKCAVRLATYCTNEMPEAKTRDLAIAPANMLLNEITRNVQMLYRKAILKQPHSTIEKGCKITNFYIKLLGMLSMKFPHQHFPCSTLYMHVLQLALNMPDHVKNTPVMDLVGQHILYGLSEVMLLIYKGFPINMLLRRSPEQNIANVALKYLHASVMGRDGEHLQQHMQAYEDMFSALFAVSANFMQPSTYNAIIEYYASLAILDESRQLKAFLMGNVLAADHMPAYASMQTLLVLASSPLLSPNELFGDFCHWRKHNDWFALCSQNPRHLLVGRLLRHTFQHCSPQRQADVMREFGAAELNENSLRFYASVGLSAAAIADESALAALVAKLNDQLIANFERFESGSTVKNYYQTVVLMKVLTTLQTPPKREIFDKCIELFAQIHTHGKAAANFALLSEACLAMFGQFAQNIANSALIRILKCLRENLRNLEALPMIALKEFLSRCKRCENLQVQQMAQNVHETCANGNIGSEALAVFEFRGQYVPSEMPDAALFCYKHKCKATALLGSQVSKRQRLDECRANNTKEILHALLEQTHQLASQNVQMDEEDIALVKDIVAALQQYTAS